MPKLLIASNNQGKVREYRFLLRNSGFDIISPEDAGISETVAEEGSTYEENASIKAVTYSRLGQTTALADDSGLEVDALGGKPGIKSARFAGEAASDVEKVDFLLGKLAGVPWEERTAHFKCVIAIVTPTGRLELCQGECHGMISFEVRGEEGFGYDPIFYLPGKGKCMAELPPEVKNQISHRAQAAHRAQLILQQIYSQFVDSHNC
ncbi:MAG: XTP/dITP diphosphatase [Dehalococcoidia bacterium]|nr:XTP/dITP diphosphatase [Dehalococcoidia bacterium]